MSAAKVPAAEHGIDPEQQPVLAVAPQAIVRREGRDVVFRLRKDGDKDIAEAIPVQPGRTLGELRELAGLRPGDTKAALKSGDLTKFAEADARLTAAVQKLLALNGDTATGLDVLKREGRVGHPLGKNPGDVWTLATSSFRGAHHATYPLSLATRTIRAGCPEARCTDCRLPWRRAVIRALGGTATRAALAPTCACTAPSEPGLVLDPFIGSGTTAVAAETLGRDWLGIELNPDFAALAEQRIAAARAKRRTETNSRASPSDVAA